MPGSKGSPRPWQQVAHLVWQQPCLSFARTASVSGGEEHSAVCPQKGAQDLICGVTSAPVDPKGGVALASKYRWVSRCLTTGTRRSRIRRFVSSPRPSAVGLSKTVQM